MVAGQLGGNDGTSRQAGSGDNGGASQLFWTKPMAMDEDIR